MITPTFLRSQLKLSSRLPLIAAMTSFLALGVHNSLAERDDPGKEVQWKKDVSKTEVPEVPAQGMINGRKLVVEKATISSAGILTLRQGKEFFADLEFMIFTFVHDEEKLPGTTFNLAPSKEFGPHIYVKHMAEGDRIPKSEVFMNDYTLKLELGEETEKGIPGKIYLCVPDDKKSFVAGTFTAVKE